VLGGEDHEGGTLPLGTVLDDRHRLAGIAGLYVCERNETGLRFFRHR
jgi:hypothetical protein